MSKAGKEVLIKSVAQSIPAYCMTTFILPLCLMEELERMMNSFWWGNKADGARGINWMRWERQCTRNDLGGMGFRNLHLFNLAMLGKIGWRLMTDPNALVCKILKAKYFPEEDFLNAEVGHNPSFTWRSICSTQDILRSGLRWRIGGGELVRVYQDPWLRRDARFFITSDHPGELHNMRVNELMIPGTRMWDVELILELFSDEEAKEVLGIPLHQSNLEDKMIWHYDRKGRYSVRSAYHLACNMTINSTHTVQGSWKKIWKLQVPPKVKNLLWRTTHNCLPTKSNLISKGIQINGECGICHNGLENVWHSFVTCQFAEGCWEAYNLSYVLHFGIDKSSESFKDFLFIIFDHFDEEISTKVGMLLWQVWKCRNDVVWNNRHISPQQAYVAAETCRKEWSSAQKKVTGSSNQRERQRKCNGWHNLSDGWFKCGIDAAFFPSLNATGAGMIIWDAHGNFVAAKVECYPGCMRVDEGEAMGLKEALSWIKQRGLSKVEFVIDNKIVYNAIRARVVDDSELGVVVSTCRQMLDTSSDFRIRHVSRDANTAAHRLARISKNFPFAHVWNEPPDVVECHLIIPCVCS